MQGSDRSSHLGVVVHRVYLGVSVLVLLERHGSATRGIHGRT